jgi:hypothetical protein
MNKAFEYNMSPFEIKFQKVARPHGNWKEECLKTAQHIKNSTDKPIIVALSGGIDGEIVCRSLMESGIYFEAATFVHDGGTNDHDTIYAKKFCVDNNIKHHLLPLNIDKFITEYVERYKIEDYVAGTVFRYSQIYYIETLASLGYTVILGGGEQIYHNVNDVPSLKYDIGFLAVYEWMRRNNSIHFPYFYMTTPEIMASYLNEPVTKTLTACAGYYPKDWMNYSHEKIIIAHRYWPSMTRRRKFTGWDTIQPIKNNVYENLRNHFKNRLKLLDISVTELRSQLGI